MTVAVVPRVRSIAGSELQLTIGLGREGGGGSSPTSTIRSGGHQLNRCWQAAPPQDTGSTRLKPR